MRIRRSLPILLVVVVIAAALTLVVQLRKHAPPEAARLLPGADGFLYVNLQWMRRANVAGHLPEVSHDPEYQQFIEATGFQFERDLDEAAFAIHYPPVTQKSQPATADQARFSEVFVGKIQIERLSAYLKKLSASVENYRSVDVYNIPLEGRTVRVAILGVDTVAASNHSDPLVIRGIIDRSRKLASPFGGPSLLRQHYKHVPLASLAWAIFRVQPSSEPLTGPSGISFLFTKPAEVVASVRYLGLPDNALDDGNNAPEFLIPGDNLSPLTIGMAFGTGGLSPYIYNISAFFNHSQRMLHGSISGKELSAV